MEESAGRKKSDLPRRTARHGRSVILFAKGIPDCTVNRPLIRQLVRAGTSVGANYNEACEAESDRDFCHKMAICSKEAGETKCWLEMLATAEPSCKPSARTLWKETDELHRIFAQIVRNVKRRLDSAKA